MTKAEQIVAKLLEYEHKSVSGPLGTVPEKRRDKILQARPPGHHTSMLRKRMEANTEDEVEALRRRQASQGKEEPREHDPLNHVAQVP